VWGHTQNACMAREVLSIRVDNHHEERLHELQEQLGADDLSETVRRLIDEASASQQTRLQRFARRVTDALALTTVFVVGLTFWLPLELRALTVGGPAFATLGTYGLTLLLSTYEPAVSQRLRALVSGGEPA